MSKKAAVELQPLLEELGATILLFIYDEVVVDVPEDIGYDNLLKISQVMIDAIPLDCGMTSDIEVGSKWDYKMSKDEIDALHAIRSATEEESDEYEEGESSDVEED